MRRAEALRRNLKGATGFRSLPLSFLAGTILLVSMAQVSASPVSGELLNRWRGYALEQITPHYDWAAKPAHAQAPDVLDTALQPAGSTVVALGEHSGYSMTLRLQSLSGAMTVGSDDIDAGAAPVLRNMGAPISGDVATTGLRRQLGRHGSFGVSVVLAHQRFAASALAGDDYSLQSPYAGAMAVRESSLGTGVAMDITDALMPRLNWYAGFRSRINMDSFQNYRGIYGNFGDMDLPAQLSAGLDWSPVTSTHFKLGVDRIKYSSIEPFVSAALPRRLLAVLGDGTSPEFSWKDLDVYSLTMVHDINSRNRWSVRYSSRQQPLPTSRLLSKLLMEDAASYAVGLAFQHDSGAAQWRFAANYAPAEFVLGVPTSAKVNQPYKGRQVEFEALWVMAF